MNIYLDTCSLQRPLDSKTQVRIILEAEAVLSILGWCESAIFTLVGSDALSYEIERNPNPTRRGYALETLRRAKVWAKFNASIEERARVLNAKGFKPLDALHLASAEAVAVDYFCTCDDKLLHRAKSYKGLQIRVISPLELIREIEK
jgi:predicted nucleic acid-binding protein